MGHLLVHVDDAYQASLGAKDGYQAILGAKDGCQAILGAKYKPSPHSLEVPPISRLD